METYPGTDYLVRICYSCDLEIPTLDECWADSDESEVVCTKCKDEAERSYSGETHFRPITDFLPGDLG